MKSFRGANSTNLFEIIFYLVTFGLGIYFFREMNGTQKIILAIVVSAKVIAETIKDVLGDNGLFSVNENVVNFFTTMAYVAIFYVGCGISSSKNPSIDMIVLAIIGACMVVVEKIIALDKNKKSTPLNLSQSTFNHPLMGGIKKV